MTMLSFRVDEDHAELATSWAGRLGVDRSQLLRDALRIHLARLAAEQETAVWGATPLTPEEASLDDISDWGPAEDWSDWSNATR